MLKRIEQRGKETSKKFRLINNHSKTLQDLVFINFAEKKRKDFGKVFISFMVTISCHLGNIQHYRNNDYEPQEKLVLSDIRMIIIVYKA